MPTRSSRRVEWLDDAERRAWLALLEVGSGLYDALNADLREIGGITLEDYEVLHLLSAAPERRLRVGELADGMLASRTRLSQRLDRLAERGYVERVRCPDDRRAIHVVLTDEGLGLLTEIAPLHLASARRRVFDHLDPADVDAVAVSLEKLVAPLREWRQG